MSELVAVKAPNYRGVGESRVYHSTNERWTEGLVKQVFVKRQHHYDCHPLWNGCRSTPMAKRELRALLALRSAGVNVPVVVSYWESDHGATLVTGAIPNALPLNVALQTYPESANCILTTTASAIAHLHRAGWIHGALYPCHLLVQMETQCRVFMIDLEKAKRSRRTGRDLKRLIRYLPMRPEAEKTFLGAHASAYHYTV